MFFKDPLRIYFVDENKFTKNKKRKRKHRHQTFNPNFRFGFE